MTCLLARRGLYVLPLTTFGKCRKDLARVHHDRVACWVHFTSTGREDSVNADRTQELQISINILLTRGRIHI